VKPVMANLEIVTSSIIQDELEHVGTGVRPWKMEGGEGEIDSGSDYVLTPPLVKEPEEMSPIVIEGLRNPESVAGEQERAAGAAPLVEEEHLCVQEHNTVAYQGIEAAKTPNAKESCVVAAKDCISVVAVAPPSKHAGPRSTHVGEKRVRSAPVESDSRKLGNGDAPSDSGFSVCRLARKSWAIHLAETVLIILAQAICGRPCPNATIDSRLRIHHLIQEGKMERRESKKTTVQTKAVVAEHVLGSSNPVKPKVARTARKQEKRRASKAESQRLKKDNTRPRWVGGSWGTALEAERKLAIYDVFYRQKRGVETRNTAHKHGKCFKAATSSANTSRTTNAVACNWALGLTLVLVAATMLFATTMSPVSTPLCTGLMISPQAFVVSPPSPMQTASRGPRGSNSSVTATASRAIVPTGSVAHPQARSSRSSRVPEPGVVAPPGSSSGGVGMSSLVAGLCIFAAYLADGWLRNGFTGRRAGEGATCHRRGKGKVMGNPLRLDISSKYVSKLLLLLALLSSAHAARPWSVEFGGCAFSGDSDGAPLVRSGSCPTTGCTLSLRDRGITSVKNDSFAGMGACT